MTTRLLIKFCILSSFTLLFSMGHLANAQDGAKGSAAAPSSAKKEKKQSLSFEDELVEGNTQKPELFYLFQKKNFNYKRLIRLRENFLPEMRQTAEDVQRSRGAN